jgi:hypothetical protein
MTSQPERVPDKVDDDGASVKSAYETLRPTWVAGPGGVANSDRDRGAAGADVPAPEDNPDLIVLDAEDDAADSPEATERSPDNESAAVAAEAIAADVVVAASSVIVGNGSAHDVDPQWHEIQAHFVDDPRGSVQQAAAAADAAVSAIAETLHERQAALSPGSDPSDDPGDTEQLREAFRSYRTFCQNLAEISKQLPPRAMVS